MSNIIRAVHRKLPSSSKFTGSMADAMSPLLQPSVMMVMVQCNSVSHMFTCPRIDVCLVDIFLQHANQKHKYTNIFISFNLFY